MENILCIEALAAGIAYAVFVSSLQKLPSEESTPEPSRCTCLATANTLSKVLQAFPYPRFLAHYVVLSDYMFFLCVLAQVWCCLMQAQAWMLHLHIAKCSILTYAKLAIFISRMSFPVFVPMRVFLLWCARMDPLTLLDEQSSSLTNCTQTVFNECGLFASDITSLWAFRTKHARFQASLCECTDGSTFLAISLF